MSRPDPADKSPHVAAASCAAALFSVAMLISVVARESSKEAEEIHPNELHMLEVVAAARAQAPSMADVPSGGEATRHAKGGGETILADSGSAASPRGEAGEASPVAGMEVVEDVEYKRPDDRPLVMDLYLPAEETPSGSPVVVYVHDEGRGDGDRPGAVAKDVMGVIRALTERGIACASLEYRPGAAEGVADCKDAIRFLADHAGRYRVDPRRIGVFGSSTGGHLALMAALVGDDGGAPRGPSSGDPCGEIRCVGAFYPRPGLAPEGPAEELGPVDLVAGESPAIFLAYGGEAAEEPPAYLTKLRDVAIAEGVAVKYIVAEGPGLGLRAGPIGPTAGRIIEATVSFFERNLAG